MPEERPYQQKQQQEVLKKARHNAIEVLQACEDLQEGRITSQEFEKRISKVSMR